MKVVIFSSNFQQETKLAYFPKMSNYPFNGNWWCTTQPKHKQHFSGKNKQDAGIEIH